MIPPVHNRSNDAHYKQRTYFTCRVSGVRSIAGLDKKSSLRSNNRLFAAGAVWAVQTRHQIRWGWMNVDYLYLYYRCLFCSVHTYIHHLIFIQVQVCIWWITDGSTLPAQQQAGYIIYTILYILLVFFSPGRVICPRACLFTSPRS